MDFLKAAWSGRLSVVRVSRAAGPLSGSPPQQPEQLRHRKRSCDVSAVPSCSADLQKRTLRRPPGKSGTSGGDHRQGSLAGPRAAWCTQGGLRTSACGRGNEWPCPRAARRGRSRPPRRRRCPRGRGGRRVDRPLRSFPSQPRLRPWRWLDPSIKKTRT